VGLTESEGESEKFVMSECCGVLSNMLQTFSVFLSLYNMLQIDYLSEGTKKVY